MPDPEAWHPDYLTNPIEVQWPGIEYISIVLSANFVDIDPDPILVTHGEREDFGECDFAATEFPPSFEYPPVPRSTAYLTRLTYAPLDTLSLANGYAAAPVPGSNPPRSAGAWGGPLAISPVALDALLGEHILNFGVGGWHFAQASGAAAEIFGPGVLYGSTFDSVFNQAAWAPRVKYPVEGSVITDRRGDVLIGAFWTVPVVRATTIDLEVPAHQITGSLICLRPFGTLGGDDTLYSPHSLTQSIAHSQTLDVSSLELTYRDRLWQFAGVAAVENSNTVELIFEPAPQE